MTTTNKIQKPFGITIACNLAAQAIQQNVAPISIIIGNLLLLQTSEVFPKELDVHFFATSKRAMSDVEKKMVVQILPGLKKPAFQIPEFLENTIKINWVKKIPLPQKPPAKKFPPQNKIQKTFVSKETVVKPLIVVKKNKLT